MANPWSGGIDGTDGLDLQPSSSSSSAGSATESLAKEGNSPKRVNKVSGKQDASPAISAWTSGETPPDDLPRSEASPPPGKKMAVSWAEMIRAWPKTTLCIVGNEFCERFSFYGMRTVLMLYFVNQLRFSNDTATMLYNGFIVLCYLTPIIGSILADGYIGKFKTILILSLFYSAGQVLLAFASTKGPGGGLHPWLDLVGLIIICFGTGGIKPCVSAFGGDQFEPHQEKMLSIFFSAFYFAINSGSMISTFITPMFRATPCMGQDSCYPMAFGVPAALMVAATLLFVSGSFWYKKVPPKENIFAEVFIASFRAIRNRFKSGFRHAHWIDYYFDTHLCTYDAKCKELQRQKNDTRACHKRQLIGDMKAFFRLIVMLLPAPMFWALYDQQGSRWMLQSLYMDCRLWGNYLLLPDQMQTLNAVLILLFIPIFQIVIYPVVSKCFKITPLRKMAAGGVIAALAFVVSALVQFRINETLSVSPALSNSFVSAINAYPGNCNITICTENDQPHPQCRLLMPGQKLTNLNRENRDVFEVPAGTQRWDIKFNGANCPSNEWKADWQLDGGATYWMMVNGQGVSFGKSKTEKPRDGMGEFLIGITLAMDEDYHGDLALCRRKEEGAIKANGTEEFCDPKSAENFYVWKASKDLVNEQYQAGMGKKELMASVYAYKSVRSGNWLLFYMDENNKFYETGVELPIKAQGGIYMLALTGPKNKPEKQLLQVISDNTVSILWQIPQIAIITAAEILFSITGLEFAYSQAPPSMKTVVQAAWLLTTATGDALIIVITLFRFSNMAFEFLFYAALMCVVTLVFALLAYFYYDYKYYTGGQSRNGSNPAEQQNDGQPEDEWSPKMVMQPVQMYGSNEERKPSVSN